VSRDGHPGMLETKPTKWRSAPNFVVLLSVNLFPNLYNTYVNKIKLILSVCVITYRPRQLYDGNVKQLQTMLENYWLPVKLLFRYESKSGFIGNIHLICIRITTVSNEVQQRRWLVKQFLFVSEKTSALVIALNF
jgi:hypothetical protein